MNAPIKGTGKRSRTSLTFVPYALTLSDLQENWTKAENTEYKPSTYCLVTKKYVWGSGSNPVGRRLWFAGIREPQWLRNVNRSGDIL